MATIQSPPPSPPPSPPLPDLRRVHSFNGQTLSIATDVKCLAGQLVHGVKRPLLKALEETEEALETAQSVIENAPAILTDRAARMANCALEKAKDALSATANKATNVALDVVSVVTAPVTTPVQEFAKKVYAYTVTAKEYQRIAHDPTGFRNVAPIHDNDPILSELADEDEAAFAFVSRRPRSDAEETDRFFEDFETLSFPAPRDDEKKAPEE